MKPWTGVMAALLFGAPGLASSAACPPEPGRTLAQSRFPQQVAAGWLSGRLVLAPRESQPVLARLREIRRGPDGEVQAVLLRGGVLARFDPPWEWGADRVSVPLQALALLGEDLVLVGLSPAELDTRPALSGNEMPVAPDTPVCVGLSKPAH